MASLGSQFSLLLWKNFRLQSRKKIVTVFEILVPIFLAGLLVIIRAVSKSDYVDHNTVYSRFRMDELVLAYDRDLILYTPSNNYTDDIMFTVKTALSNFVSSKYNLINSGIKLLTTLITAQCTVD